MDTFENHGDKEVANILEAEGEMTHTADTLSNMIDNLLGKLNDKKGDPIDFKSICTDQQNYLQYQQDIKIKHVEPKKNGKYRRTSSEKVKEYKH